MKKITKTLAALLVLASFMMQAGCNKPSSEKRILSFKFYEPEVEATIKESAKTIIATVPEGTNVTALVPIITVSDNAKVNPASGVPQNFTNPKTYTVTAEDGTQAVYTVTVVIGDGGGGNGDDNGDDNGGGNGGGGNGGEELQTYTITTFANPAAGGTVTGGGTYDEGAPDTLKAIANTNYTFDHWQDGNTANPRAITVMANATYTAYFTYTGGSGSAPEGAIAGKFTINASGNKVYFSQGNLQYQASTNIWRFAENQWDYVGTQTDPFGNVGGTVSGSDNRNIGSTYSGWIDLFGWGTSGWNSGNTYYRPWDSNSSNGGTYGPTRNANLTDIYANADWGVYNAISNGGNQAGLWRTLTKDEWVYVFNTRSTSSGIRYVKANVNNVNGVILLPDDWSSSYYSLSLSSANTTGASFSSNTITLSQWNTLEQHGAVFLPAAGLRGGTSVSYVGSHGFYWSVSSYNAIFAYEMVIEDLDLFTFNYYRYSGQSVRLVRFAQ